MLIPQAVNRAEMKTKAAESSKCELEGTMASMRLQLADGVQERQQLAGLKAAYHVAMPSLPSHSMHPIASHQPRCVRSGFQATFPPMAISLAERQLPGSSD